MADIRPIVKADVDQVVLLFEEDLASLNIEHDKEALRQVVISILESGETRSVFWGIRAEKEGDIDGVLFANRFWSIKHAGPALWLEQLYVRPAARRLGLGRELVNALLDWAEDNGIQGIDLESYRLNAPASILYRTLGFRRLGRERFTLEIGDEEGME